MIKCPNCQSEQVNGTIYCPQCGAKLIEKGDSVTLHTRTENILKGISPPTLPNPALLSKGKDSEAILYLVDTKEVICLKEKKDYTLGRITEAQKVIPDIDLSPHNAYKAGVSRIHASINTGGAQTTFKDLGSSNGSRLNGIKIAPHAEHTVQHGDIITLGALKIQILINIDKETGENRHAD